MVIRPCYVEVDSSILHQNYINIKKSTNKDLIAVVKANAYGHGLIPITKYLVDYGVSAFAVATVEEAVQLRSIFENIYILILGPVHESQLDLCIKKSIAFPISSYETANTVSKIATNLKVVANVHFAVDTGMGRIGYFYHKKDNSIVNEILSIKELPFVNLEGIFTHFASADDSDLSFMETQYSLFRDLVVDLKDRNILFKYIHCQNSAATFMLNEDLCTHVRVGLSLYGYNPSEFVNAVDLKPCLSWACKITHVKKVPAGTPIGYGSNFVTDRDTVVATIPVGYADGFRRSLSNKGLVSYNNTFVKVIGNVCMDQTMIDVTDIQNCCVGDTVYLLFEKYTADDMANTLDTISYEILCAISNRVPRLYK